MLVSSLLVFTAVQPLMLYIFIRRYVNQLEHDPIKDIYTASVISPFAWKDRKYDFKVMIFLKSTSMNINTFNKIIYILKINLCKKYQYIFSKCYKTFSVIVLPQGLTDI